MTAPNPKDPQADLYLKQEIGKILGDRVTFGHHHYFRARNVRKNLLKLFQAHQQELEARIRALMFEVPDPIRSKDFVFAYNEAIEDVLYLLNRKIGELNG